MVGNNASAGHEQSPVRKIVVPKKKASQFLVAALQLGESRCSLKGIISVPRDAETNFGFGSGQASDQEAGPKRGGAAVNFCLGKIKRVLAVVSRLTVLVVVSRRTTSKKS